MTGVTLFDDLASREARDVALERVDRGPSSEWKAAAAAAVLEAAERHPDGFIVDDVWAVMPENIQHPPELRAMGPVVMRARNAGAIRATGTYRPSSKVTSHAVPRQVWVKAA